ncbi:hypothetical protein F5Y04DRAFT_246945 [Hypomontagnella monticulosa]|nr:hypothetical protein F5Y04DRAFT_246945 [Hypomontagnella monticulosa]
MTINPVRPKKQNKVHEAGGFLDLSIILVFLIWSLKSDLSVQMYFPHNDHLFLSHAISIDMSYICVALRHKSLFILSYSFIINCFYLIQD